jgi:hypothetical protein
MTLALGEIIEQGEMNFCVFANKCVIYDPFTKKRRARIFCREYRDSTQLTSVNYRANIEHLAKFCTLSNKIVLIHV